VVFFGFSSLMIGVIFLSNATLEIWLFPWLSVATLIYPFSYLITTLAVLRHGKQFALKVVLAGFLGSTLVCLSQGFGQVGLASLAAYLVSQMIDLRVLVHFRARKGLFWPLLASWLAATSDTLIFFTAAFWGKELDWLAVAMTDYGVKICLDWMWFWLLRRPLGGPAVG
jgi:uncharacterized PurR-regulated membrane protein YhhQ (DUF165 family)